MMLIQKSHVIVSLLRKSKELWACSDIYFEQHDETDFDIIMNLDTEIQKYTLKMKQK